MNNKKNTSVTVTPNQSKKIHQWCDQYNQPHPNLVALAAIFARMSQRELDDILVALTECQDRANVKL